MRGTTPIICVAPGLSKEEPGVHGTAQEKPMSDRSPFSKMWIGSGIPGAREDRATYMGLEFESLPVIPGARPDLAWLSPMPPEIRDYTHVIAPRESHRGELERKFQEISASAEQRGITLPGSFDRLMKSFELQERVPSRTGCYLDLPEDFIESPFREGDFILRFLNDCQVVYCWYLYFLQHGDCLVIASQGAWNSQNDTGPFLDELDFSLPQILDEVRSSTILVAETFDDFLFRFWIENRIASKLAPSKWSKGNWGTLHKLPTVQLSRTELAYVCALQPGFVDPWVERHRGFWAALDSPLRWPLPVLGAASFSGLWSLNRLLGYPWLPDFVAAGERYSRLQVPWLDALLLMAAVATVVVLARRLYRDYRARLALPDD